MTENQPTSVIYARASSLEKDSLKLHKGSRSQEKLNWGIRVLFAKNYTDNLSEEVIKGQVAKLQSGQLPYKPHLGYRTIGEKGKKIHSPKTTSEASKRLCKDLKKLIRFMANQSRKSPETRVKENISWNDV
jgi:hypothetical protein